MIDSARRIRALLWFCLVALSLPATAAEVAESSEAEVGSVEWLARTFLKQKNFPDRQRYYVGEMRLMASRPTPGAAYHDDRFELDLRVNEKTDTSAAVAAGLIDRDSKMRSDYYLFLRREDDGWKLAAVRTFLQPRGTGQMYAAVASKGKDVDARDIREMQILQALQYNDGVFKATFQERQEKLDTIAAEVLRKGVTEVIHGGQRSSRVDQKLWESIRDTGLNYVELQENGTIEFNAAAFAQSAVGYLWVPPRVAPPSANPENYILVEPLGGQWYLYRRQ